MEHRRAVAETYGGVEASVWFPQMDAARSAKLAAEFTAARVGQRPGLDAGHWSGPRRPRPARSALVRSPRSAGLGTEKLQLHILPGPNKAAGYSRIAVGLPSLLDPILRMAAVTIWRTLSALKNLRVTCLESPSSPIIDQSDSAAD